MSGSGTQLFKQNSTVLLKTGSKIKELIDD